MYGPQRWDGRILLNKKKKKSKFSLLIQKKKEMGGLEASQRGRKDRLQEERDWSEKSRQKRPRGDSETNWVRGQFHEQLHNTLRQQAETYNSGRSYNTRKGDGETFEATGWKSSQATKQFEAGAKTCCPVHDVGKKNVKKKAAGRTVRRREIHRRQNHPGNGK